MIEEVGQKVLKLYWLLFWIY